MAVRKVAQLGHPVLREVCKPVEAEVLGSPEFERLVHDMVETMIEYEGVGLAAPQVHESVRLVVWVPPDAENVEVLINPELEVLEGHGWVETWEGCLSVHGMRALVRRPDKVRLSSLDADGERHARVLTGFAAVVVQHECDHLDGVIYVDKAIPRSIVFESEYARFGPPPEFDATAEKD